MMLSHGNIKLSISKPQIIGKYFRCMLTFGDEKGRIINIDSKILKTFDEKYISFDSSSVSVIKFSPNGATMVCGTSNGETWVLDSENRKYLGNEKPFRNKTLSKITNCAFYDDHIFAIAVRTFKYNNAKGVLFRYNSIF